MVSGSGAVTPRGTATPHSAAQALTTCSGRLLINPRLTLRKGGDPASVREGGGPMRALLDLIGVKVTNAAAQQLARTTRTVRGVRQLAGHHDRVRRLVG